MPQELSAQFESAVSNVTVNGKKLENVIAAHTEVRELLENDNLLRGWGVDSILIGSYARHTSRYPGKDVDVFLRFTELSTADDPRSIYDGVERVLEAKYGLREEGGRVTRQARSLNISFPQASDQADLEFSVDAVPAVPFGQNWGIPNRDPDVWSEDPSVRWVETNPIEFATRTNKLSTSPKSPTVGDRNAYCPVVRLLRQIRHVHLGDLKPGGLYIEIAAYYAWNADKVAGSSWAALLSASLNEVAAAFAEAASGGLVDPVLGTPLKPALDRSQWTHAAGVFQALADKSQTALQSDPCKAAKLWREILGTNERGQVLPLPPGCDAAGFAIGGVAGVSSLGSTEARGFALPSHRD
ncbi:nucleotidyltransferase [Agrococcus sediminis]|uniref:nucleotidyltransferase n=1 Tax=Agrococcus sediminis TaxID=2599924 RepID=UPI00344A2A40